MSKWSEKVNVHTGADAGSPTIGALSGTADFLRMNTDLSWVNRPLVAFANNDVIQSNVGPFGNYSHFGSSASLTEWGGWSVEEPYVCYSRADQGERDTHRLYMDVSSDAFAYFSEVNLFSTAISTGAAGQFAAGLTLWGENDTQRSSLTTQVNSTTGGFLTLTHDATNDSSISLTTHPTGGGYLAITGFKAQSVDLSFQISDEDGVVTKFSPMVADDPAAIAYLFDTANALVDDGAALVSIRNNATPQLIVSKNGGLSLGAYAVTYWGGLAVNGETIISARDTIAGDPDYNACYLAVQNSNNGHQGVFFTELTVTSAVVDLGVTASGGTRGVHLESGDTFSQLRIYQGATNYLNLQPFVADGASAVAYLLDTRNALANAAARVLECQNNGTQTFANFADGSIKTGTPTGGTAGQWKLGVRVAATVVLQTDEYIQLDVGGTLYKLGIVDTA